MIVHTVHQSNPAQPLTKPFPVSDGAFFALRTGDLCSPNSWAAPTRVRRAWLSIPRPFLSWRRGARGFYVGWKVFGCDLDHYKAFPAINPAEVYRGSIAMQGFTIRFSTNIAD